jgi:hypothetical protein
MFIFVYILIVADFARFVNPLSSHGFTELPGCCAAQSCLRERQLLKGTRGLVEMLSWGAELWIV